MSKSAQQEKIWEIILMDETMKRIICEETVDGQLLIAIEDNENCTSFYTKNFEKLAEEITLENMCEFLQASIKKFNRIKSDG